MRRVNHHLSLAARTVLASFLVLIGSMYAAQADLVKVDGIPDGFEQLAAPRLTQVSVSYGGENLGSFSAHFTPSSFQFDAPAEVIKNIPAIKSPALIKDVMATAMPSHTELLCTVKHSEGCGNLLPDITGVIFDENQQSVELFINPKYLSVVADGKKRYLPLPAQGFSSVYAFNGAVNGNTNGQPNYSVQNNAILAWGEKKLDADTSMTNRGLRFDTTAASIERHGWSSTGGLFRSQAMQLVSDHDMAGFSYATSRRTRLDAYKTEGNPVIVYLPRRSFVSIYREGRLLSSQTYEAGNQTVDTSELPDGAYNIELRIQDADGQTRTEQRFFAKNPEIPAADASEYYMQAGVIRKAANDDSTLPQLTSEPLLRVGTVRRLNDSTGFNASVLGVKDRAVSETGFFWLHEGTQLRSTFLASSRGDLGWQSGFMQSLGKLNASADFRRVWAQDAMRIDNETWLNTITQATGTFSYALNMNLSLGLRASYIRDAQNPAVTSVGPYADWRLWQRGESTLGLSANYAKTGDQNDGSIFLNFSYKFGDYGITSSAGNSFGSANQGPIGNARIWHNRVQPDDTLLVGAGINADQKSKSVNADADWQNTMGRLRGSVQQAISGGNDGLGYGGNFAVNAMQLQDEVHLGGSQNDTSAVLIETDGDTKGPLKIFVNGVERSKMAIGGKQTLYLTPFHTYKIRVAPAQSALLDYDNKEHNVTLYPGNVAKLHYTFNQFYVVVAQIKTPDGQPLVDAVLQEGKAQITTNAQGRLQAELAQPKTLTFVKPDQSQCQVQLPAMAAANGILLYRDALICQ